MTPDDRAAKCGEAELGPLHEAATKVPEGCAFPVDHSRETPALAALGRRGYAAEFVVDHDGLRIANTDRRFRPEDVRIRDYYRFEGTSDPDDMSVIYALEARDGTRGTLTDAFGSYADPTVGAIVDRMCVVPFANRRRWRRALLPAALGALTVAATVLVVRHRAPSWGSTRRAGCRRSGSSTSERSAWRRIAHQLRCPGNTRSSASISLGNSTVTICQTTS